MSKSLRRWETAGIIAIVKKRAQKKVDKKTIGVVSKSEKNLAPTLEFLRSSNSQT